MNRRSTAALMLAAVFFAGVAATLGTLRIVEYRGDDRSEYFSRSGPRDFRSDRPSNDRFRSDRPGGRDERPWSELARLRVTDRLVQALDLTDEQVDEVRDAMDQYQTDAQEVWEDVLPVLAAQRDSLNAEFERILTPAQYERFTRYLRADRARGLPDRRSPGRGRR